MGFLTDFKIDFLTLLSFFSLFSLINAVPAELSRPHQNVRRYDLTVTWETGAPDGFSRKLFKVNGKFPAPLLEFNEGDDVIVLVNNQSPHNISIHYHGIEMLNTPWSDGVPGLTQRPIQPGCAFAYKWKATQHGSYWYHSHSASQLNDGLYGALIIHPKAGTAKPYGLVTTNTQSLALIEKAERNRIPLLLGDWRHTESKVETEISERSHIEHLAFDSLLINGKGKVNCLTPQQQQPFITPRMAFLLSLAPNATLTDKSCLPPEVYSAIDPPGGPPVDLSVIPHNLFYECSPTSTTPHVTTIKRPRTENETWVVFDLIGASGVHLSQASIDEISGWVVALDGNYIEPVRANVFLMVHGQRYTILAKFTEAKKYTLRLSSIIDPQILFATAIIDFQIVGKPQSTAPSVPFINERGQNVSAAAIFYEGSVAKPYPPAVIPATVDATYKLTMRIGTSTNIWAFNTTARVEDEAVTPLLFSPQPGRQDNHTITVPSEMSWVDYIMLIPNGQPAHPIHFHGRHFHVIGSGSGAFPWSSVAEASQHLPAGTFNLVNPQLRDTYYTPGGEGWLAVRRPSDNEGVWLVHCHVMSHLQGGMSMLIQDGTDSGIFVPPAYRDYQCAPQT